MRAQKKSSKTVLVVDDDPDLLALVALLLKRQGYRVLMASNGREGLDQIERTRPDLMLVDMNMPVMSGGELIKEVRALYGCQIQIVIMTASEDAGKRARETEAAAWIGKPFDLETLIGTVGRVAGSN